MAALFASMAVKSALDNLSSLLPARTTSTPFAATASSQGIEHLRMLEPVMSTIHATLHDAEQRWNLREESAMLRVKELTDLAYDAEDVVEEYEYEVNRCRVEPFESSAAVVEGGGSSSKHRRQEVQDTSKYYYSTGAAGIVPVPTELVHRASKIIERFAEIKEYADSFTLSENDGERRIVPDIRPVRQTSSIVYAPRILGREEDKEQVIRMLKLGSKEGSCIGSHMSVLAIVGMGGLGKTTLAQLVYNDTRVRQSFDLYAWVCVSEYFDVENITRKIITSLTRNTCYHLQAGALQAALEGHVKEKRVFLVMDDVWNERSDYWELFCKPLSASRQCHIIVTTRSKAVARLVQTTEIYNLNCLSPDDSWSLFKQTALVQQEIVTPPSNFVETGTRITEKCKGLPLAIKTLGSILRFETDENKWRDILENELWNIKQSRNQVLPALELSYKYMPVYLKRCFVSLSLFRKNMYIDEYRVISLWKLLNLLQCDGSDDIDEIGSIYFNELMQRSLLQNYIEAQRIVMHDLVHDLACLLAGGEFFRLDGGKQTELPRDARYLSILSTDKSIQVSNAPQSLRVITMMEPTDVENPEVLFFNCKKLRIIDVGPGRLANAMLDFIGEMKLLRHFYLSGYKDDALPNSVDKLFNLRSLDIAAYLCGIGRLVNLHTLPDIHFSPCGSFFNIRELRNMNEIRKLVMYGLCDVKIGDANEAHLHCKKNLEILELDFFRFEQYSTDTVCGVQLLESLRPHHQSLKILKLRNFNCEIYPSWLGSSSFTMLTEILLHNCQSGHLPTLGELPSLKILDIRGMEHVQCIGQEFCSLDPRVKGFQTLKKLSFHDMYQLSEWIAVEDGEFPHLETLWIWSAFELRSLPLVPFLSLSSLHLYDCTSLLTFPASPALRELSISTCAALNELPGLPSLRSLGLFNCPSLATVGHFPSLSVLQLHAPFKEEILYRLVNSHLSLERLSVWSDTLTSINLEPQSLPSLTEFEVGCPNLNYCGGLVSLTSLKILNIRNSPKLHVPGSLRTQLVRLLMPFSNEWIVRNQATPRD